MTDNIIVEFFGTVLNETTRILEKSYSDRGVWENTEPIHGN